MLKEKLLENYLVIFSHKERIRYREHKIKHGKAKRVIYTCITGKYDTLKTMKYIDKDWDYICFTDNASIKPDGVWEIKPLQFSELDNSRNNRWHKLNPHLILSDYENSIYIDGNIRIKTKNFLN